MTRMSHLSLLIPLVTVCQFVAAESTTQASGAEQIFSIGMQQPPGFVRIHAADALCAMSSPDMAARLVDAPIEQGAPKGYRIGVWRIRAQAPGGRDANVAEIAHVAGDPTAADRLFAVESLAKLGQVVDAPLRQSLQEWLTKADGAEAPMICWLLAIAGDQNARDQLSSALRSGPPVGRARAAYALRYLGHPSPSELEALSAAADASRNDAPARSMVLGSAYVLSNDAQARRQFHERILALIDQVPTSEQCDLCAVLGLSADRGDLPLLEKMSAKGVADVTIAAKLAAWRIETRAAVLREKLESR